jgi:hypothetical protein
MTTARAIIEDAYILSGIRGIGETIEGDEASYALRRLNGMLDSWAASGLMALVSRTIFGSIASGQSFTVGLMGDVSTSPSLAPRRFESGFFRSGGIDYPFRRMSMQEYSGVTNKASATQFPSHVYYERGAEDATCYMFPALSSAVDVYLQVLLPIGQFETLDTDQTLTPGVLDAVTLSLAELLCVGVSNQSKALTMQAFAARERAKRNNVKVADMEMGGTNRGNILNGWVA